MPIDDCYDEEVPLFRSSSKKQVSEKKKEEEDKDS